MNLLPYSREQLATIAKLSEHDLNIIRHRRRSYNQLGFGYQLAFVRLHNRFPVQEPLDINQNILRYVALQLSIPEQDIQQYGSNPIKVPNVL